MARPRFYEEDRVSTAVRLPTTLHTRLRQEAADRQVSVNLLVERAVAAYLDGLPDLDAVVGATSPRA